MYRAKRRLGMLAAAVVLAMGVPAFAGSQTCTKVGPATVGGACAKSQSSASSSSSSSSGVDSPNGAAARFLVLVNQERSKRGLPTLTVNPTLTAIAQRFAADMAAAGKIYHNPNLFTAQTLAELGEPDELGENVGRGEHVDDIHASFMNSTEHRDNILDPGYGQVGFAVVGAQNQLWVVEDFMSTPRVPVGGFTGSVRRKVDDIPPYMFSGPTMGAWHWVRPDAPGSSQIVDSGIPQQTQVLGIRRAIPHGTSGIVVVMVFTAVLGIVIPRGRHGEYV